MNQWINGFTVAYSNATVNVSINTVTSLNFSTFNITFGVGQINPGSSSANMTSSGTMTGGTGFSTVTSGFVLENVGTTNVSLNIMADNNGTTLFSSANGVFMFNVTQSEASSCEVLPPAGAFSFQNYTLVNTTNPGTLVCRDFKYADSADTLRIDVFFSIPYDTPNVGTNIVAVLTAQGTSL